MTEAEVWVALIGTLRQGLDAQSHTGIDIKQAYQPKKQGVNTQDTVYLFKITSRRASHQDIKFKFNVGNDNFDTSESYWLEANFQLNAIIEKDIQNENSLTSYDIVDLCSALLQSAAARQKLLEDDIGILRITDIRNPYSIDDRDQFDQDPSFDFKLTYRQTLNSITGKATSIEEELQRV